ncbi:hypothetical protein Spb1_14800 [Planctopirus ephydatiae]|uniref:Uncharacterized protein n=1 Tax=Planctopirus ephydatiae TaxID=2528019 RepID=A0A518GLX0_9PLAN|nr:hypothetical protein Spb1_14800 [Planctopirus ephydatiae]
MKTLRDCLHTGQIRSAGLQNEHFNDRLAELSQTLSGGLGRFHNFEHLASDLLAVLRIASLFQPTELFLQFFNSFELLTGQLLDGVFDPFQRTPTVPGLGNRSQVSLETIQ